MKELLNENTLNEIFDEEVKNQIKKNSRGLVGPEPTEEEMLKDAFKKMPTRCYIIYNYLKEHCVGYDNAENGSTIVRHLRMMHPQIFDNEYTTIKKDIKTIRNNMTRKIGSNSQHGYWLMTSEDEVDGQKYAIQNVLSAIETLVSTGVKKEVFYNFLNGLKNNVVANEQVRLQVTPGTETITHILSDDLLLK